MLSIWSTKSLAKKIGECYETNFFFVFSNFTLNLYSVTPEQIEQTLAQGEYSYKYYFWTHRTGSNDYWYNLGQFLDTQVQAIVNAGYKTVLSFRLDGEATVR